MIMSQRVGSRFQMDLIEMPPCQGYRHILRVVDHLSLYGFVAPLKQRKASEIGTELIKILCSAIMPEVLQSDNGAEVSCDTNLSSTDTKCALMHSIYWRYNDIRFCF
jgi:hypothetical protein